MVEPISLNRARKAKARAEDKAVAAQNRVRFGMTKADRSLAQRLKDKAARDLDDKKREP